MFVVLRAGCSAEDRANLVRTVEEAGLAVRTTGASDRFLVGHAGEPGRLADAALELERCPGVARVVAVDSPHPLASREARPEGTVVRVGDVAIGGGRLAVVAGPCSVEDADTFLAAAESVRAAGGDLLRGGAFKPRTSPYLFRGLGERGLEILSEARRRTGLRVVTEALDTRHVDLVARYADMIQVGSRNMQNFPLLEAAADAGLPVLLKRGRACTVTEWLCAAEYVLNRGNDQVVLCERGLVSFDGAVRNLLDLSCVPLARRLSHLPVLVDPSHGTGRRELVPPMARAAVAAGADAVMVEMHPDPARALSDGPQAILPEELAALVPELRAIHDVVAGAVASRPT